jgi:ADP-ribosyl-[dinitrogen reductase] hydrolase
VRRDRLRLVETDRATGLLLGLACGDALGRPVEFQSAAQIERTHGRVTEMLADGTHGQPAGRITDDTEMALCIARSLAEHGEFVPEDIAARFVEWYESDPFDIGLMTMDALRQIRDGAGWDEAGQAVWEARPEGQNAGNGSVMRCAPYAIAFADQPDRLAEVSRESSAITHADPRCTAGCAVFNRTLAGLLTDESRPLEVALDALGSEAPDELVTALEAIPDGIDPSELQSSGYVVHTLQTGLYHGLTADSAEDAIVTAVNMGNDTDTVGAVAGAVAGARFGAVGLPERWSSELSHDDELRTLTAELATL